MPYGLGPAVLRFEALDDRGASRGLRADEARRIGHFAELPELPKPFLERRQEETRAHRDHDDVGQFEAELLPRLEEQGLRSFRVVGPHVDVHESPAASVRGQEGDPVRVVVRSLDRDHGGPEDSRHEELRGLEGRGREHVAGEMRFRGCRRGGRGEVPRRGATDRREVPFAGLRDRDGDGPVFEGIRGVDGVILDPDFADLQCLSEVRGPSQRCAAHREIDPRGFIEDRKEFAVSPQVARSAREIRAAE